MNTRNSISGAIALLAALYIGNAHAAPLDTPAMQVVSYSDLNLGSRAGVALLYKRIQKAANEVCDNPPPRRQLRFVTERKDCSARALNRAVAQIGVPALDALHLAKTGHSKSAQVATNQ